MITWLLLAFANSSAAVEPIRTPGRYQSVAETEYSITLTLDPQGHAQFEFVMWEAEDPHTEERGKLSGAWTRSGNLLTIRLTSGKSAVYAIVPCLSYREFGETGCSMGLSLVKTDLADSYGLKRYGLWNAASLRIDGRP